MITDPQVGGAGRDADGTDRNEIPGAKWYQLDDRETVTAPGSGPDWKVTLSGYGDGAYHLQTHASGTRATKAARCCPVPRTPVWSRRTKWETKRRRRRAISTRRQSPQLTPSPSLPARALTSTWLRTTSTVTTGSILRPCTSSRRLTWARVGRQRQDSLHGRRNGRRRLAHLRGVGPLGSQLARGPERHRHRRDVDAERAQRSIRHAHPRRGHHERRERGHQRH